MSHYYYYDDYGYYCPQDYDRPVYYYSEWRRPPDVIVEEVVTEKEIYINQRVGPMPKGDLLTATQAGAGGDGGLFVGLEDTKTQVALSILAILLAVFVTLVFFRRFFRRHSSI